MDLFLFFFAAISLIAACVALSRISALQERLTRLEEFSDRDRIRLAKLEVEDGEPAQPEAEPEPELAPKPSAELEPPPLPVLSPMQRAKIEPVVVAQTEPKAVAAGRETELESEPVVATAEKPPRSGPSWREILERIYLWPPMGDETTEVRLASWWTIRVGIVLGVIAAVFFGVHVSQDIPPALRLVLMGGVGAGLIALGLWLESKFRAFGQILSAGGLAILYVTAFAAYAFEPTKVIDNPWVGLAVQLLGVGVMAGFSIWKRSEPLAAAAILLGCVSCWFSHAHGLHSFTLAGLLFLALTSAGLFFRFRWAAPLVVAMVGGYLGYALLIPFRWLDSGSPGFIWIVAALLGFLVIFHLALHAVHLFRGPISKHWRMTGVLANSSASVVVGVIAVALLHNDSLDWFYLAVGVALLAFTALEVWKPRVVPLASILFLKSMAGFALFVIYRYAGPAEWIAVALQALALMFALRWSRSRALEAAGSALWLVAMWLFFRDVNESWRSIPVSFDSVERWLGMVFALISIFTLALHRRWVAAEQPSNAGFRNAVIAIMACLNGLALSLVFLFPLEGSQQLLVHVIVATVVAGLAIVPRTWPPLVVSGFALALVTFYHLFLPIAASVGMTGSELASGGLLFLLGLGASAIAVRLWPETMPGREPMRLAALGGALIAFLSLLIHTSYDDGGLWTWLFWMPALPLLLIVHAEWRPAPATERGVWEVCRWLVSIVAGLILIAPIFRFSFGEELQGASAVLFAGAALGLLTCFRSRDPIPIASAAILTGAGVFVWLMVWAVEDQPAPWLPVVSVIGIPIAISAAHRWFVGENGWKLSPVADGFTHFVWMLLAATVFEQRLATSWAIAACCGLALAAFGLSLRVPAFSLRPMSILPAILGTLLTIFVLPADGPADGPEAGLWIGFALTYGLWMADHLIDRRVWFGWTAGALTLVLGLAVAIQTWDLPWSFVAAGAIGLSFVLAWRFTQSIPAVTMGCLTFGIALGWQLSYRLNEAGTGSGLIASLLLGTALLASGLVIATTAAARFAQPEMRTAAAWIFPALTLLIAIPALAWRGVPGYELATAWWGVTGSIVFLGGLMLRVRSYRIAGLAALGLCVIRMFIVDLDDTFGRIIAFGAVAVALLAIGYLYAKFRDFIEGDEADRS